MITFLRPDPTVFMYEMCPSFVQMVHDNDNNNDDATTRHPSSTTASSRTKFTPTRRDSLESPYSLDRTTSSLIHAPVFTHVSVTDDGKQLCLSLRVAQGAKRLRVELLHSNNSHIAAEERSGNANIHGNNSNTHDASSNDNNSNNDFELRITCQYQGRRITLHRMLQASKLDLSKIAAFWSSNSAEDSTGRTMSPLDFDLDATGTPSNLLTVTIPKRRRKQKHSSHSKSSNVIKIPVVDASTNLTKHLQQDTTQQQNGQHKRLELEIPHSLHAKDIVVRYHPTHQKLSVKAQQPRLSENGPLLLLARKFDLNPQTLDTTKLQATLFPIAGASLLVITAPTLIPTWHELEPPILRQQVIPIRTLTQQPPIATTKTDGENHRLPLSTLSPDPQPQRQGPPPATTTPTCTTSQSTCTHHRRRKSRYTSSSTNIDGNHHHVSSTRSVSSHPTPRHTLTSSVLPQSSSQQFSFSGAPSSSSSWPLEFHILEQELRQSQLFLSDAMEQAKKTAQSIFSY